MKKQCVFLFLVLLCVHAFGSFQINIPINTTSQAFILVDYPHPKTLYIEGLKNTDHFSTPNGQMLRYTTFTPSQKSVYEDSITLLLLHGRATFIEYYEPLILPLLERGVRIITYDLEGQGRSTRFLENRKKGHVDSFDTYLQNLDALIEHCIDDVEGTFILMGYSLGGHIALRYLEKYPENRIDGAFVISPMLGIPVDWLSRIIVRMAHHAGLGEWFVPHADEEAFPLRMHFDENDYTRDPERYREIQMLIEQFKEYAIGGTTFSWAKHAFDSCEILQNNAESLGSSIFIVLGGGDSVIDINTAQDVCNRAPKCRHKVIEGAYHELFREDLQTQQSLWKAFDSYIQILLLEKE